MGRPARVEDVRVVVVCDGRPEEEGYCIDSQEELAEHFRSVCLVFSSCDSSCRGVKLLRPH